MVWFGDRIAARVFARSIGTQLGTSNGDFGPAFVYGLPLGLAPVDVRAVVFDPASGNRVSLAERVGQTVTYAVAAPVSAVPLPASGVMVLSAFGALAWLRRRKTRAA